MQTLAQKPVYRVVCSFPCVDQLQIFTDGAKTADSPRVLSTTHGIVSPRHLVVIHDVSSCEHEIDGTIAKLSLYNLTNVTIHLHGRILSSFLEISQCTNLTMNFQGSVPAVIQLDPDISNLKFNFALGCEPGTFVVSPHPPGSAKGLGLSSISVSLTEDDDSGKHEFVFVDGEGRIATELVMSSGGKLSEQYKIEMARNEEGKTWTMETVEKAGGMPVLNKK